MDKAPKKIRIDISSESDASSSSTTTSAVNPPPPTTLNASTRKRIPAIVRLASVNALRILQRTRPGSTSTDASKVPNRVEAPRIIIPEAVKQVEAPKPVIPEVVKQVEAPKPVIPEVVKQVEAPKPDTPEVVKQVEAPKPVIPEVVKQVEAPKPDTPELNSVVRRDSDPKQTSDDLTCPICLHLALYAIRTKCGKVFCRSCLQSWVFKKPTCPACRSSLSIGSYEIAPDIIDKIQKVGRIADIPAMPPLEYAIRNIIVLGKYYKIPNLTWNRYPTISLCFYNEFILKYTYNEHARAIIIHGVIKKCVSAQQLYKLMDILWREQYSLVKHHGCELLPDVGALTLGVYKLIYISDKPSHTLLKINMMLVPALASLISRIQLFSDGLLKVTPAPPTKKLTLLTKRDILSNRYSDPKYFNLWKVLCDHPVNDSIQFAYDRYCQEMIVSAPLVILPLDQKICASELEFVCNKNHLLGLPTGVIIAENVVRICVKVPMNIYGINDPKYIEKVVTKIAIPNIEKHWEALGKERLEKLKTFISRIPAPDPKITVKAIIQLSACEKYVKDKL